MPIESDTSISKADKMAHLKKWWTKDMEAFVMAGYSRADFEKMTAESRLLFRKGTPELLQLCQNLDIEMLIVSGGISELIHESLRILEDEETKDDVIVDFSSIPILSNRFKFDDEGDRDGMGVVTGYRKPLITSGNKQEIIYDEVGMDLRRNAIVMGDIVEDGSMVRDSAHDVLLRVGFLNS